MSRRFELFFSERVLEERNGKCLWKLHAILVERMLLSKLMKDANVTIIIIKFKVTFWSLNFYLSNNFVSIVKNIFKRDYSRKLT